MRKRPFCPCGSRYKILRPFEIIFRGRRHFWDARHTGSRFGRKVEFRQKLENNIILFPETLQSIFEDLKDEFFDSDTGLCLPWIFRTGMNKNWNFGSGWKNDGNAPRPFWFNSEFWAILGFNQGWLRLTRLGLTMVRGKWPFCPWIIGLEAFLALGWRAFWS